MENKKVYYVVKNIYGETMYEAGIASTEETAEERHNSLIKKYGRDIFYVERVVIS